MPTEEIIKIDLTLREVLERYGFIFVLKRNEEVLKELFCPKCNIIEGLITNMGFLAKPDSCFSKFLIKIYDENITIEDFEKFFISE